MAFQQTSSRAGRYVKQPTGYQAFVPSALPPHPRITFDDAFMDVLSRADRTVGRLDGCAETLPESELFVFIYSRKEGVLSSQIEGTQASLMDVLEFEATARDARAKDVGDVFNYVAAMNHGLGRLRTLPLSLRLVREIHEKLLTGIRGAKDAGEFRNKQNWIGPAVRKPLLYLSYFFKKNRSEYYDRLQAVRDAGQWEQWLKFFLRGVAEVADEGTTTARRIVQLREQHRKLIADNLGRSTSRALNLLESLYRQPVVSISRIGEVCGVTFQGASDVARQFSSLGILKETTGQKRHRVFAYARYLALIGEPGRKKSKPGVSRKAPRMPLAARSHRTRVSRGPESGSGSVAGHDGFEMNPAPLKRARARRPAKKRT